MSPQIDFGSPTVSGNVNVNVESATYDVVFLKGNSANNSANTLGTVPASKVWLIISCSLGLRSTTSAYAKGEIRLNGQACLVVASQSTTTYGGGQGNSAITFVPEACPRLSAGQTIQYVKTQGSGSTTGEIEASVGYVEIDA